jgi:hypothetical protein
VSQQRWKRCCEYPTQMTGYTLQCKVPNAFILITCFMFWFLFNKRHTAFTEPDAFFNRYAGWSDSFYCTKSYHTLFFLQHITQWLQQTIIGKQHEIFLITLRYWKDLTFDDASECYVSFVETTSVSEVLTASSTRATEEFHTWSSRTLKTNMKGKERKITQSAPLLKTCGYQYLIIIHLQHWIFSDIYLNTILSIGNVNMTFCTMTDYKHYYKLCIKYCPQINYHRCSKCRMVL